MTNSYGSKTSRVLDLDAKSLQLLVARSGKAITDAEGILLQDIQAAKLTQLVNTQTFSGCVDLPNFSVSTDSTNCLVIPAFRALIGSNLVVVQGTQNSASPTSLDNYVYLPDSPSTGYGITVVYLEAWYQVLDETLSSVNNHGFYPNYSSSWNPLTDSRYFFPYGNILAHPNWIKTSQFLDDLKDPTAGYTSGRVQLQYAIRTKQIIPGTPLTAYLGDFGLTHPLVGGQTFLPLSMVYPFTFKGTTDPGLYVSTGAKLRTVDSCTYAIPLAIVYQRNSGVWDPSTNPHGCGALLSASTVSGRPDGRFASTLYLDDVVDTRSSFMGGSLEDYKSVIEQAAARLWRGALRLKLAEPEATDTNAHQLGQTLLSQEYLGQTTTSPYAIQNPINCISSNSAPQMSWTSDSHGDFMTYRLLPSDKTKTTSGTTNTSQWVSGDTVIITHPLSSAAFESAALFTYNNLSQIFKIPSAYISVSGLGSNAIKLTFYDISVDTRIDLTSPIWVVTTFRKPKSTEHFRYVPETVHTPLYMVTGQSAMYPCGKVSDFSMGYEDSTIASTHAIRTYKRNYASNIFGTTRKLKFYTQEFIQKKSTDISGMVGELSVSFQALTQTVALQTVLLTWAVSNATRVVLTNSTTGVAVGDVPLQGSMSIRVAQKSTYVLTAYNDVTGTSQTSSIVVTPPSDLITGSVTSDDTLTRIYAAPGGSLNPENMLVNYSIIDNISVLPGFGDGSKMIMLGCCKATLYRLTSDGSYEETDLQLRHQYYYASDQVMEVGFFGWFEANSTDYVEMEFLVTGMKTFHYNPTVQGVTSISETMVPSQKNYLTVSNSTSDEPYTFETVSNYASASLDMVVSSPSKPWTWTSSSKTITNYLTGVYEGVFGFNGQGYCFVQQTGEDFYRTTPCSYSGLGTPLLQISLPQVTLANIEDVVVLAQATTPLAQTATVLFNYDYVPYQGEGSTSDSYTLTYLDSEAQVTTFGTGSRGIPGLTSTASTHPGLPIATVLPSVSGWSDADLESSKFTLDGVFSGLSSPAYTNIDFLTTKVHPTVTGNMRNLLDISATSVPSLNPRSAAKRGFSNNTFAFAYVIDSPTIVSSPHTLNSSTKSDLAYWVDPLVGDDANSGVTQDVPKKSLQNLLDSLPETIQHEVTIYLNGNVVLSQSTLAELQSAQVTPYGLPEIKEVFALIKTSFKTIGNGVVKVCQDPRLTSVATFELLAADPINNAPVYGWLHLGGKLELSGLVFNGTSGVSLAAYPGSQVNLTNCGFIGGELQLLAYGAEVTLGTTSFSRATTHNMIATNSATLNCGDGVVFSKGSATGYTCVAEKHSTVNILTDSFACSSYPGTVQTEFLVKSYSIIDTHTHPNFKFSVGTLKLVDFSTLICSSDNSTPFDVETPITTLDTDKTTVIDQNAWIKIVS